MCATFVLLPFKGQAFNTKEKEAGNLTVSNIACIRNPEESHTSLFHRILLHLAVAEMYGTVYFLKVANIFRPQRNVWLI